MDIYILRDGKEIGPFSEETTKTLLGQGSIHEGDYAWHPGLPKWIPLASVLSPAPDSPPPSEPKPELPTFGSAGVSPNGAEAASEKQKALLAYLDIPFSGAITKDQAALLINESIEDPQKVGLLAKWNKDRIKLRPDLFAAEIQEQKEARVGEYFEICQTEGAEYFTKITKAHCQVLVGFLDGKFPNWDEDPKTAPKNYFFPAVAEKFPQLVAKAWKGKLPYDTGSKGASEAAAKRPATGKLRRKNAASGFPLGTIARVLVFAAITLGMFFFVKNLFGPDGEKPATPPPQTGGSTPDQPASPPLDPLAPAPAAPLPQAPPAGESVAVVDPPAPVPVEPAPPATPTEPPTPPANPDPKMAADPATPKPADPLPGFPADPLAPAPTPPVATEPGAPAVPRPPPPAAPEPVAKGELKLTKPVEVQLAYGKMKLPAGTKVKFVSKEGNLVKVTYLNTALTIPVTSTDFGVPDAPAPAVPPTIPAASDL